MICLFCDSNNIVRTKIPTTVFIGKQYHYYSCKACKLMFIDPIPNQKDLEHIYPTTYQGTIEKEKIDISEKMPGLRFSYDYQLNQIKKHCADGGQLLDFGCGTGHFIYNMTLNGYKMDGVEFSEDTIQKLKKSFTENDFFNLNDFFSSSKKYDFIRLSNVLEHFTNPKQEFQKLFSKLSPNGVFLIEGPLENNISLVNWAKWNYLRLRYFFNKSYFTSDAPTHIFFTNYKNQLSFFEQFGLETILYNSADNAWPFPEKINEIKNPIQFIKYLLGFTSKIFSQFSSKYGNTFIYVGKKK